MAKMTRAEAARILGVPENADKVQVNAAARKLIAKYHPDAHRNASSAEQAQAEKNFKLATQAKKVMLAPPEQTQQTAPRPQQQQQQQAQQRVQQQPQQQRQQVPQNNGQTRIRDNGNAYETSARIRNPQQQPQQAEPIRNVTSRAGSNTARTFHDDIPRVADDQERMIADMYAGDAKEMYSTRDDIFRRTPSMLVTLAFFAFAVAMVIMAFQAGGFAIVFSEGLPFLAMAGIAIVKFGLYDLLAAYYVKTKAFGEERGWLMLTGIECAVMSVLMFGVGMALGTTVIPVLGGLIAAALLIAIAFATRERD